MGKLRSFWKDDAGVATVDFVIVAPVLFAIFFSIFEAGWLMTRYMMLDRGLDFAVRDIRIGATAGMTHTKLKKIVCDRAIIFKDCERVMFVQVVPQDEAESGFPRNSPRCYDRVDDIEPVVAFNPGNRSEIVYIRACVVIDPIFPGLGLGLQLQKDASGGYQMTSYTAFMNEPN